MGVSTGPGPWRNEAAQLEVYEAFNGFYIRCLRTGKTKGMGDGVDMFSVDIDEEPWMQTLMVDTPEFYKAMAEMVEMEGATLRAAYFGEDDESLEGIEVEEE